MSALKILTQLVLRDLVKQKNLMLEFVGEAKKGIASLENLPILLKQAQAKASKLLQDAKSRGVDLTNSSADEIKKTYQFSKEVGHQKKMSITKPKVDMAETVKSEVIDYKGWNPKVIKGGKKEGVENLFKETKKVDLPEGVNWKDTPLPVNPKVESFYDDLVNNAYKEAKKTGRDVKTIIEETIDYKFTGNETGKEILDIIEAKFFKADGGRIGFNQGGWSPGAGRDDSGYKSDHPSYGGGEGGNSPVSSGPPVSSGGGNLNLSPVVTYNPSNQIENIGLRGNIGKLVAAGVIDLEDAITTGNIDPTIAANLNLGNLDLSAINSPDQTGILASGAIGPVNVGGSYQDFGEYGTSKNIGATAQLGNLNIGANYDFENKPNVGVNYNDPDSGWSGGVSYNFEGKPEGRIELKKTFKKGGRVGYDIGGLTGQAKNIYDSWISAGHSEEDVIAYLQSRGLYNAPDAGITSIVNTQQPIIPQGDGGDGGGGNIITRPSYKYTSKVDAPIGSELWLDDIGEGTIPKEDITLGTQWNELKHDLSRLPTPLNLAKRGIVGAKNWFSNQQTKVKNIIQQQQQAKIEAAQKLARLEAEQANLRKGRAPSGGTWDGGGGPAYTDPTTGIGGGQFTDALGNVDYQDALDPGSGEKDGGIIGYKKGGLATMFTRRR